MTGTSGAASNAVSDGPVLRHGRAEEAALLSDLALRSKGHWGYDDAFLEACRDDLTVSSSVAGEAVVAEVAGVVAGFHLLEEAGPDGVGRLDMLFVDPIHIGSGLGRVLLDDAIAHATSRGWVVLRIDADPGAEGFYLRMGARRTGEVPSGAIPGRRLPQLELDLQTRAASSRAARSAPSVSTGS